MFPKVIVSGDVRLVEVNHDAKLDEVNNDSKLNGVNNNVKSDARLIVVAVDVPA